MGDPQSFDINFIEEDEALGTNAIVSICIICVLVIGICAGIGYWYRKKIAAYIHDRKHLNSEMNDDSPTNQTETAEAEAAGNNEDNEEATTPVLTSNEADDVDVYVE